ncbi:hypothetical protein HZA97_03975 [Candidatus Woesearchaeota archaeon]|nr:hypothetical protein [Candidatus Woesearchaeota archaeon]
MINFLNTKQAKEILALFDKQWGAKLDWLDKYYFVISQKEKLYIINREISNVEFEKLNIDKMGLYVAEIKNNQIRLSIEGSQMIGPLAKKNILELTPEQRTLWMMGRDLQITGNYSGFLIIKCENDYLATGRYDDGVIANHVSKSRRIH